MTDERARSAHLVVGNYVEPHLGMPLADAKAVKSVRLQGGKVMVEVELGFPLGRARAELEAMLQKRLDATPEVGDSSVSVGWTVTSHAVQGGHEGGLRPAPSRPQSS
jgi:ATP-binding protein involved in chromosome partitioning